MKNAINWFEIPVKNFERAQKFYETVLGAKTQTMAHFTDTEGNKVGFHSVK